MAYAPLNDPEFDAIKARIDAAGDEDTADQLAADIGARREADQHPVTRFVTNLPKNIGIGSWKALVNTVDTISDVAAEASSGALAAKAIGGDELRKQMYPSLSEQHPEVMESLRNFTSQWERNDTLSDDISQGVVQFMLPFMGWLKLTGGVSGLSKTAALAKGVTLEGATAASASGPQDGRIADLIEMGRESETRLGTLLRQVSPDESLVNQYIDYMTNRTDESEAEGRWKNAVDAVVPAGVIGGLLKTTVGAYKFGKFALEDMGVSGGPGAKYQKGMVAFHGSPHTFDKFDMSKLGTGEGAQVYGYGLYFADNPKVANHYRTAGGPYLEVDGQRVFAEELDGLPVQGTVKDLVLEGSRHGLKDEGIKMFVEREIKRNPQQWGLTNRKQVLEALEFARKVKPIRGSFYEVDIDDASVAKMLDYDKQLAEQPYILNKIPDEDKEALRQMLEEHTMYAADLSEFTGKELQDMIGRAIEEDRILFEPADGVWDGNSKKYAAQYFREHDIPGLQYLDGGSRSKGNGTRNYVLFDDKLVKITAKKD